MTRSTPLTGSGQADPYAWQAHYNVDRSYIADGLNRMMSAGSASFGYDARGNLTASGGETYTYTVENRLGQRDVGGTPTYVAYEPGGGQCGSLWLYRPDMGSRIAARW